MCDTSRQSTPRRTSAQRVSLFGTMATSWRNPVKEMLAAQGNIAIDNTDDRWPAAKTAEEIAPLLRQDHDFMDGSDLVLWHHDADCAGNTARIEIGFLVHFGRPVIVHVEPGVASREYMRALCLLYPKALHWAETMADAMRLIAELTPFPEEAHFAPVDSAP